MTIEDIKALIASDESRTLELKKTTDELKDGMHVACAFLNTDGGWLIFGIAPKSLKIVGQQVTDDTKREISQALAGIEPAYDIQPIYVDVPEYLGNKVIAFHFDGWEWGKIANPGILPPKITPENIKESHESFPYNRNMAQALYRSTFLESWGSGIRRIIEACQEQGVEEPTWRWDGAFVYVTFRRPGKLDSQSDQVPTKHRPSTDQDSTGSQPVVHQFSTSSLPVKFLIDKAGEQFMSAMQLADLCELKDIRYFRKMYLNPALEEGAIERLYPDRPNHPKQKYRLTEAAKEWKEINFKS